MTSDVVNDGNFHFHSPFYVEIISHVVFINRDIKVCSVWPVTPASCKCSLAQGVTDGQVVSECRV